MNAIVKQGGVVTLPSDVVESLKLGPGTEVAFRRNPDGSYMMERVSNGLQPTRAEVRAHIEAVAKAARLGLSKEFANMTTDEYMEFIRGD